MIKHWFFIQLFLLVANGTWANENQETESLNINMQSNNISKTDSEEISQNNLSTMKKCRIKGKRPPV